MLRFTLLATLLLAALAPPAEAALVRFSFDDIPAATIPTDDTRGPYGPRGLVIPWRGCMTTGVYQGSATFPAYTGAQFLAVTDQDACGGTLTFGFDGAAAAPAVVRFAIKGKLTASAPPTATIRAASVLTGSVAAPAPVIETRTVALGDWQLITFRAPAGRAYAAINITTGPAVGLPVLLLDDVFLSTTPLSPDVTITTAPPATTTARNASVAFAANADAASVTCSLDGGRAEPCRSPFTASGLALGRHELVVQASDAFGAADPSPATTSWAIVDPPAPSPTPAPATPAPLSPTPGPLSPTPGPLPLPLVPQADPCTGAPDGDGDGISDRCDTVGLPGDTPIKTGVQAKTVVLSGEVFVKLPASRARRSASAARAAADPGFVPLKGVAVLPVGSEVDARKGEVQVVTATGATAKGSPKRATSRVAAAIFQIRQRRAKRRAKGSNKKLPPSPTQLILRSPQGALDAARCGVKGSRSIVRSLSATIPKGVVRVTGAAANATATRSNTTLRVVDRCDGTYTEVGAGRLTLRDKRRHRNVQVRGGQSYFVRRAFMRPTKSTTKSAIQKGR